MMTLNICWNAVLAVVLFLVGVVVSVFFVFGIIRMIESDKVVVKIAGIVLLVSAFAAGLAYMYFDAASQLC